MSAVKQILTPEAKDLGEVVVRRSLPDDDCPMVGPFIFFDHLGPATFPPGKAIDVRPHPHINLATVTYLFEGSLMHRDSVGSVQEIRPGAVNWMNAGRGIVHSERSPDETRETTVTLHAIQTWVALPDNQEESEPWFRHHAAETLPAWETSGATVKLIAGEFCDRTSPVQAASPILYLDVQLTADAKLALPPDYSERAVYAIDQGVLIDGNAISPHRLVLLTAGQTVHLGASIPTRCVVIGGEPVGLRQKWWNFVSSRPERIEQAKQDWQAGRFATVPGETEFIPLPDD
ncbi:MAG: pirin family protein [Cyanobacteria bacterium J06554_6]